MKMEKVSDKKALEILSEGNQKQNYFYNGNNLYVFPKIVSSTRDERNKVLEEDDDMYINSYVIVSFDDV